MKEIGELLREARSEKGFTLEKVSKETKINIRHLQALEEGNFSAFAGEVYLKGALRSYAETVGLDTSNVISRYNELSKQAEGAEPEERETQRHAKNRKDKPFYSTKERRSFPSVAIIWLSVLVILVGGSIWYSAQNDDAPEGPYDDNYAADENELLENEEETDEEEEWTEPDPDPDPEPDLAPDPELVEESREETTAAYRIDNVTEKEIELNFTDRCWFSVNQDGAKVEEGTYESGQTLALEDAEETEIILGFAAGVQITVNGIEIPELTWPSRMEIVINKGDS